MRTDSLLFLSFALFAASVSASPRPSPVPSKYRPAQFIKIDANVARDISSPRHSPVPSRHRPSYSHSKDADPINARQARIVPHDSRQIHNADYGAGGPPNPTPTPATADSTSPTPTSSPKSSNSMAADSPGQNKADASAPHRRAQVEAHKDEGDFDDAHEGRRRDAPASVGSTKPVGADLGVNDDQVHSDHITPPTNSKSTRQAQSKSKRHSRHGA